MKAKSMVPTPEDLTLDDIQSRFATDEAARAYLEDIRWPNGVVCPHCKNADQEKFYTIKASATAKVRAGLRQCAACKKQFTCTVGTIFEDSHIPLRKWLVAWYLLCSSKKGISSLQIQRMLGLGSYRTALFMMHRIRYALKHPSFSEKLMGTVEVDETYVGGKAKPGTSKWNNKSAVVSLVQRGGDVRSTVMERVTGASLKKFIRENVVVCSPVYTDEAHGYVGLAPKFEHESVKHSRKEYVRGKVHTNTVEGHFSLLKRGIIGTFHQVSRKHLPLYVAEFDHRYCNRKTTDGERTVAALRLAEGKRLTLKPMKKGVEPDIQNRPKILQFTKRNVTKPKP
jgi:transposase-like protein